MGRHITESALNSEEFTSTGTFTVPADVHTILVTAVGAGGGGGGGAANVTNCTGGAGGGGGVTVLDHPVNVAPGDSIAVTIGAGGNGGVGSLGSVGFGGATGGRVPDSLSQKVAAQPDDAEGSSCQLRY